MAEEDTVTDVAPVFGSSVAVYDQEALVNAMEDTVHEGARGGDVSYMSFSGKRGRYKIGTAGREPGEDEHFLVALNSFKLGWICWRGGRPIAKRSKSIFEPPVIQPDPDELGPFDSEQDGWSRMRSIVMKSLENQEQIEYSTNSNSCVAILADLQKEILTQLKAGEPAWPIIQLGMEEFTVRGNTNFKITYDIVKWVSDEEVMMLADPEVDPMALLESDQPKVTAKATAKRRAL